MPTPGSLVSASVASLAALFAGLGVVPARAAAPEPPAAADLCVVALANRPADQLQERASCALVDHRDVARGGPITRVAIVRVPLVAGPTDVLLVETRDPKTRAATWTDFGMVGGDSEYVSSGQPFVARDRVTLDSLTVVGAGATASLEVRTSSVREMGDKKGGTKVSDTSLLLCAHRGELVCVRVSAARTFEPRGDMRDLKPYAWTRSVAVTKTLDVVLGPYEGTPAEGGSFEPEAGTHTFAALAALPFVRVYPTVSTAHPDALKDVPDLQIPDMP